MINILVILMYVGYSGNSINIYYVFTKFKSVNIAFWLVFFHVIT